MDVVAAAAHDVLVEGPRVGLAVLLYHLIGDFLLAELLVREVAGRLGGLGGQDPKVTRGTAILDVSWDRRGALLGPSWLPNPNQDGENIVPKIDRAYNAFKIYC